MYFLSNLSGCPRIAAFPSTFAAKKLNLVCPRIASFLNTLTNENWSLGCPKIAAVSSTPIAEKLEYHSATLQLSLHFS